MAKAKVILDKCIVADIELDILPELNDEIEVSFDYHNGEKRKIKAEVESIETHFVIFTKADSSSLSKG